MPAFEYVSVDGEGRKQKGVLEADSARQVRQQLRDKGLLPVSVEPAAGEHKSVSGAGPLRRGMSAWELALITRQLATLIAAGIPVEECLRAVSRQTERPASQSLLLAVRARVIEGYTLAQAFSEFPQAFPDLYRATVAAGEKSGHLDLVLNQLADYTESRYDLQKKIQGALIYPVILTVLATAIVMGLLTYVVPDIVKVFQSSRHELPLLTRGLIATSHMARVGGPWLLLILVTGGFALRPLVRQESTRYKLHRLQLRLPLVGRLARGANATRFASTLSILTRSSVPLVDALRIAAEVTSNLLIRDAIRRAAVKVTEGGSLSRALEECGYFPPMMMQMIASGEQSGELDQMLSRAAIMQEKELSSLITTLVGLFEPLMLLVMAGVVLIIVLAIMLPILSMNNLVH
ncbi:MAG TPA: type II secretion system inner membrane protein GspF [Moraxellaceae bacterium]|nr:type II secretion system inner membrane protein GspF [Moraxellaceae bacterium]